MRELQVANDKIVKVVIDGLGGLPVELAGPWNWKQSGPSNSLDGQCPETLADGCQPWASIPARLGTESILHKKAPAIAGWAFLCT